MPANYKSFIALRAGRLMASIVGVAALLLVSACRPEPEEGLPRLNARIDQTSVSGISSGAYMAGQFQVAHSRLVVGAAIIAGGPYGCAESVFADLMPGPGAAILNMSKAINGCMLNALTMWGVPNPDQLARRAATLAEKKLIDPLDSLKTDRVYLFAGQQDRTVRPEIVAAANTFYLKVGVPEDQITHVTTYGAGHAFVTEDAGLACDISGTPYVVDCDYDQAGALLKHIYGPLKSRSEKPSGQYIVFDQRDFTKDLSSHGMSDFGVAYVPSTCQQDDGCRVHIAFHGCSQNRATVENAFVEQTGFARWADTNQLIVLFPQVAISAFNAQGCWDWWGYTGQDYLTREAAQIQAVRLMLEHLAGPRSGRKPPV